MDSQLAELLADCLEWIDREGGSIDQAVSRYPEHAAELKALLSTGEQIRATATASPRPEFRAVAKTRLLNRIAALPNPVAQPEGVTLKQDRRHKPQKQTRLIFRRFTMGWLMALIAAVTVLFGGGGVAYASTSALPGDALYPVKNAIQDFELALNNDEGDVDLLIGFLQENISEMNQLAAQNRWQDLEEGIQRYEENLQTLLQTRTRLSYEDAPNEEALTNRIQTELHLQTKKLEQLQTMLQIQEKTQEKIQEAIQQTEQGNIYGPADGGTQDGAGPGEPQGTQNQSGDQNGSGPSDGGCLPDASCGDQNGSGTGGGSGSGQGGKP